MKTDPIKLSGAEPAGLAADYMRAFAGSLTAFSDFDAFLESLSKLVESDDYLKGAAVLPEINEAPDFEELPSDETVLGVADADGIYGHLKYKGRTDGQLFGAADLHLMGGIAGLLSGLITQAGKYRKRAQAYKVLQYLVNQLPLGVVCFDLDGSLIIQSRLSQRLLGEDGLGLLDAQVELVAANPKQRYQAHLEIESRLVYTEGRVLKVDDGTGVVAFVLYDMSGSQEKLKLELERGVYLSASKQEPHTVALLEDRSAPGAIYRELKQRAKDAAFEVTRLLVVDAFSCLCVFEGRRFRSVRYLLGHSLPVESFPDLSIALLSSADFASGESPSEDLLEAAKEQLEPSVQLYRPELLVLDAYPATTDSLQLLAGEQCIVCACRDVDEAEALMITGRYDGLFIDLDAYNGAALSRIRDSVSAGGAGVKIIYTSCLHTAVARQAHQLGKRDLILHKPFVASVVEDLLAVQFELS